MKKAPVPETTYISRPVIASVLVFIKAHNLVKTRFVIMMKRAGIDTIICTTMSGFPAKCSLIVPSAGAMAAPAITVRREMERIVNVSVFLISFINI
jgi:hypothetical protein